jgi:hypothetical protein
MAFRLSHFCHDRRHSIRLDPPQAKPRRGIEWKANSAKFRGVKDLHSYRVTIRVIVVEAEAGLHVITIGDRARFS